MVITNLRASLYTIVLALKLTEAQQRLKNPSIKIAKQKSFTFKPGVNIITNKDEKKIITANIELLKKCPIIEVLADDSDAENTIESFVEIDEKDALRLIEKTVVVDTLETLLKEEKEDDDTRPKVVEALEARIKKLNITQGAVE